MRILLSTHFLRTRYTGNKSAHDDDDDVARSISTINSSKVGLKKCPPFGNSTNFASKFFANRLWTSIGTRWSLTPAKQTRNSVFSRILVKINTDHILIHVLVVCRFLICFFNFHRVDWVHWHKRDMRVFFAIRGAA